MTRRRRGDLLVEARERALRIAVWRRGSSRAANENRPREAVCDRRGAAAAPRRRSRLRVRRDRSCRARRRPCTPACVPAQTPASAPARDRRRAAVLRPRRRRRGDSDGASCSGSSAVARRAAAWPSAALPAAHSRYPSTAHPSPSDGSMRRRLTRGLHRARSSSPRSGALPNRVCLELQQVGVGQPGVRRRVARQLARPFARTRALASSSFAESSESSASRPFTQSSNGSRRRLRSWRRLSRRSDSRVATRSAGTSAPPRPRRSPFECRRSRASACSR